MEEQSVSLGICTLQQKKKKKTENEQGGKTQGSGGADLAGYIKVHTGMDSSSSVGNKHKSFLLR